MAWLLLWGGLSIGALSAESPLWQESPTRGDSPVRQLLLNEATLETLLTNDAPLPLPLPDGSFATFQVDPSPIFEPGFPAAYRGYRLISAENPHLRGHLITLDGGLHAIIDTATDSILVEPLPNQRSGLHTTEVYRDDDQDEFNETILGQANAAPSNSRAATTLLDGTERTYRMVLATDGEFGQLSGGTVTDTLNAVTTRFNILQHVFQRDVGISLQLLAATEQFMYLDPLTDPFTPETNNGDVVNQAIATFDTELGFSNYDIGHVIGAGRPAGGGAYIGAVCRSEKGGGISYYGRISTFLHEVGHQFNAHHTFSGASRACANPEAGTAYEPGSGNGLMGYSTFCGPDNTGERILGFANHSIERMQSYVSTGAGATCGTSASSGNLPPVPNAGTTHLDIPASTPFHLAGSATDPDGDDLLYSWTQHDRGPVTEANQPEGNVALFRWFAPDDDPTRTFPRMSDLLAGRQTTGELLPNYSRDMRFRFVAYDDGSVTAAAFDEMTVAVAGESGPFRVLAPSRGASWSAGQRADVIWDVAGSDLPPVSCNRVNIDLSVDGGLTFPLALGSNVPNSGHFASIAPNTSSDNARVRVACATHSDHFFFALSNAPFELIASSGAGVALAANPQQVALCEGDSAEIQLTLTPFGGYNNTVPLTVTAGATQLSTSALPATVAPTSTHTLTLTANGAASAETASLTVTVGTTATAQALIATHVASATPALPAAISPAQNDAWVSPQPILQWATPSGANRVDIQITTDPLFATDVFTLQNIPGSSYELPADLALEPATTYFWRLRALNACGSSDWTARQQFHTSSHTLTDALAANVVLWLDGNDVNANGAASEPTRYRPLPTWLDKSVNAVEGISTATFRAIYLAQQPYDGLGRVELRDSHFVLTDAVPHLDVLDEMFAIAVFSPISAETPTTLAPIIATTRTVTSRAVANNAFTFGAGQHANSALVGIRASDGVSGQFSGGDALTATVPIGDSWLMVGYGSAISSTRSGDQSHLYLFGDKVAGDANGVLFGSGAAVTQTIVGGLQADLAELIIFNRELDLADRQAVEGYLAHKWELSTRLAPTHPHRDTPPDGSNVAPVVQSDSFDVDEFRPNGTPIGQVVATDSEPTLRYAIASGDPDGTLTIDPTSGMLSVANQSQLDALVTPIYYLTVNVTDVPTDSGQARTGSAVITVTVNNVNMPPAVSTVDVTIDASTPVSTEIAQVEASDLDTGDTLSFTIVGGNDAGAFAINGATGVITVADNSSFASPLIQTHTLTIMVQDDGMPVQTVTATQQIVVTNCLDPHVVTVSADSGPCSLRQTLRDAAPDALVTFDSALISSTIYLSTPLTITQGVLLDGGSNAITLSGDGDQNGSADTRLIYVDSADAITITNLTLTHGFSDEDGGAIYKTGTGALWLSGCDISQSSALAGGALRVQMGNVHIKECTLQDNAASGVGGAIRQCGGDITVQRSSFLHNSSGTGGGAISQGCSASLAITNTTFFSNTAGASGGGLLTNAPLTLVNTTFSHNVGASGAALRIAASAQVSMTNSILANSISGADCAATNAASLLINQHNIIEDGSCADNAVGNIAADPQLDTLQRSGGHTQVLPLLSTSPAIDAGALPCPTLDQRNFLRDDGACDIGALEAAGTPTVIQLTQHTPPSYLTVVLTVLAVMFMVTATHTVHRRQRPTHKP